MHESRQARVAGQAYVRLALRAEKYERKVISTNMEYIKPPEIASKIMTLIDEADEKLVVVSPYNDFLKWEIAIMRGKNNVKPKNM